MGGRPAAGSVGGEVTERAIGAAPLAAAEPWKVRLARVIGLAEGEGGRAARLLGLVFAMSSALVLLKAAQSGIFLSSYPRTTIPWAFAASAVTLATSSMASVPLAARLGPSRLATLTLTLSAAVVIGLRVLLATNVPHVPFVLYVAIEAIAGLLLIQVWSVVSEATNARSAKRLLPVAGIGGTLAWTVVGLMSPGLVHLVGAAGLLVIAPALLLFTAGLVLAVARFDLGDQAERGQRRVSAITEWGRGFEFLRRVPLMRIAVSLSVLALLTEQLMDYLMMSAASDRFPEPGSCASFFGAYYGITAALSLLVLLGASGRLLAWLGASGSLLVTPVITVAIAAAAAVHPGFFLVVALRASDRVLKQSMWSSAMEQTQTPLPVLRRAQARALSRGVIAPAAYAVAAVALALVPGHVHIRWLAVLTLGGCAVMAALISRYVRVTYEAALRHAIDDRRLDLDAGGHVNLDADACRALTDEMFGEDEGRSSMAAELLRASRAPMAREALVAALAHPLAAVRATAIEALAARNERPAADAIAARLGDPDVLVRHAAARALFELDATTDVVTASLEAATRDLDAHVAAAARVAAVATKDRAGARRGTALLPLLEEGDVLAVEVLRALSTASSHEPAVQEKLAALLATSVPVGVRREALRAATRLRVTPLLPQLMGLLDDPAVGAETAERLATWGDDSIASSLEKAPVESARRLASTLALAPRTSATLFFRLLSHADGTVREEASRALGWAESRGSQPVARALVEPLLDREIATAYRLYAVLGGLAHDDGTPDWEIADSFAFLGGEVERRIAGTKKRILRLLALGGSRKVVRAVEFGLRRPTPTSLAKVAELLDVALPPRLARRVVPLFERLSLRDRVAAARRLGVLPEDALGDPLAALITLDDVHLVDAAAFTYGERFRDRFPARYDDKVIPLFERMTFLRSVPLFGELSGEDLRLVAEMVEELTVEPEHVLFAKGDPGDDLYFVVRGLVAVRDGDVEIATFGEREFFGELAVLDREPRSADAVTAEISTLLRLRSADLAELMARRPQIQEEILMVLVRRLRHATEGLTSRRSPSSPRALLLAGGGLARVARGLEHGRSARRVRTRARGEHLPGAHARATDAAFAALFPPGQSRRLVPALGELDAELVARTAVAMLLAATSQELVGLVGRAGVRRVRRREVPRPATAVAAAEVARPSVGSERVLHALVALNAVVRGPPELTAGASTPLFALEASDVERVRPVGRRRLAAPAVEVAGGLELREVGLGPLAVRGAGRHARFPHLGVREAGDAERPLLARVAQRFSRALAGLVVRGGELAVRVVLGQVVAGRAVARAAGAVLAHRGRGDRSRSARRRRGDRSRGARRRRRGRRMGGGGPTGEEKRRGEGVASPERHEAHAYPAEARKRVS
jgi:CRP-like cAMP-binding protein/HEAT repeat protein